MKTAKATPSTCPDKRDTPFETAVCPADAADSDAVWTTSCPGGDAAAPVTAAALAAFGFLLIASAALPAAFPAPDIYRPGCVGRK